MVEIIGLGTMGALIGLLAWSMAGECESEKRRISGVVDSAPPLRPSGAERGPSRRPSRLLKNYSSVSEDGRRRGHCLTLHLTA
jgi:hypothetical protein